MWIASRKRTSGALPQCVWDKMAPGDEDPPDFLATIPPRRRCMLSTPDSSCGAGSLGARASSAHHCIRCERRTGAEIGVLRHGRTALALRAAQAAFDQGHFARGYVLWPLIVPNFDARKFSDVPVDVWKTLYPLPYEASLRPRSRAQQFRSYDRRRPDSPGVYLSSRCRFACERYWLDAGAAENGQVVGEAA